MRSDEYIIKLIREKSKGRKLALRWRNEKIEKIMADNGLYADIYISESSNRIQSDDKTYSSKFLDGKRLEYYIIVPDYEQNTADVERYKKMGFYDIEDILWINHFPSVMKNNESDIYGNVCENYTESPIKFRGFGASAYIGKNVKLPKNGLSLKSDCHVHIGNNTDISYWSINLIGFNELVIGTNVRGGVENIALNYYSKLLIGDNCTFGDGWIRTGRNRCIEIGNDCMFSWKTSLLAHDGHMIFDINSGECLNNTAGECKKTIILGDHVWVGGEVDIIANTEIGSGSICGYRSLIKGSFPNNCVIAGHMASVIKTDIAWSRGNICLNNDLFEKIPEEYRRKTDFIQ